MKSNNTLKRYVISSAVGLIGIVGAMIPTLLMALPAFLAYVATSFGLTCFALSCGIAAGAMYALMDVVEASYMLAIILPAALVLWYGFKRNVSYRSMVALCSISLGICYYLYICLPSILAGKDAFYEMESIIKYYADLASELSTSMSLTSASSTVTAELFNAAVAYAPEITILMVVLSAMCFGFFDVIIARLLIKTTKDVKLRPMAPFMEWQLSRSFTIGVLVLIGGSVILSLVNMKNSSALLLAVDCLFTLPTSLMGACLVDFFIRAGRRNVVLKRVLFTMAYVIFLPYSAVFLFVIGLIDRLFKIRKRFRIKQL